MDLECDGGKIVSINLDCPWGDKVNSLRVSKNVPYLRLSYPNVSTRGAIGQITIKVDFNKIEAEKI